MNEFNPLLFETVIGLEVHLQFNTRTKIFCGCANTFGEEKNTQTCPVCLGFPGALPVFNQEALKSAIKVGLALNCKISPLIKFDRKNYFYPDLPKGYQISQFDHPVARDGFLMIVCDDGREKKIRINRAHIEEDAGKLIHDDKENASLVDYNRAGTPLMEIVTEPDLSSSGEAFDYLQTLKLILQYLGVSDCDMEKGSLRCDANISLRKRGELKLGTKAELKNINSFKAVKIALEYEERRQAALLANGQSVLQETRLWDENKSATVLMRSKEEAHDYRYFPEPDLVPFMVDQAVIDQIKASLPEGPSAKKQRLIKAYKLSDYDARILISDPALACLFETCAQKDVDAKTICNWINGALLAELNARKKTITEISFSAGHLVDLIKKVDEGVISHLVAKDVLGACIDSGKSPGDIIREQGLSQISDKAFLDQIIDDVLAENPKVASEVKGGKQEAIGFLIGQTMRKSQGKANPKMLKELITIKLLQS